MRILINLTILSIVFIILILISKISIILFILSFISIFAFIIYYNFKNFPKIIKTRKFIIKKGRNFATGRILGLFNFRILFNQSLEFKFKFTELDLTTNTGGWEKIGGFKNGIFGIHKNSARLGFRVDEGKIRIGTYVYDNGVRIDEYMPYDIELNREYKCSIYEYSDYYLFNINYGVYSKAYPIKKTEKGISGVRYMSFPYAEKINTQVKIELTY